MTEEHLAIIDVGTNSARLVLMNVLPDGSYKLVDELRETLRLGEHINPDGNLSETGIERMQETARIFARFCRAHDVRRTVAVATAAMRDAKNGSALLQSIREETGLPFEILSGEQEAYFDYVGAVNTLPYPDATLVDVGGGSAEVVRVVNRRPAQMTSLPLGAITLTDQFECRDKAGKDELRRLDKHVLRTYREVPWISPPASDSKDGGIVVPSSGGPLIGIGGTVRNIGKVYKRKIEYPLDLLHGLSIPYAALEEIYWEIRSLGVAQRRLIPGLSANRADIIIGGLAAVYGLAKTVGASELVVSGRGLRDGLFLNEVLGQDNAEKLLEDPAISAATNLMRFYDVPEDHALHITDLALSLFDQLAPVHGLGAPERRLLNIAALLHDVGIAVNFYNHAEHGFYLLTHTGIDGLTHRELVIVAYAVASHSGSGYQLKRWADYRTLLNSGDAEIITRLGAILFLCELLDRSESGSVQSIRCRLTPDHAYAWLAVTAEPEGEFELRHTQRKLPEVEKALGIKLLLED